VINTSGYYTYLLSSLPGLQFEMKPPFSFNTFLETVSGSISANDVEVIKTSLDPAASAQNTSQAMLKKWRAFDNALRNELVKIRAARKHQDPDKYLRENEYSDPRITNLAMNAYKNPSILESEKILDKEKWAALDELMVGHYYDLDSLIIYAQKLLILEKWERIRTGDARALTEKTLQATG